MSTEIEEHYEATLEQAREDSALTSNPRTTATFIALANSGVRAALVGYLTQGYPFDRVAYPQAPDFELVVVDFRFHCRIGTICINPPLVRAVVNLTLRKVISADDDSERIAAFTMESIESPKPSGDYIVIQRTGFDGPGRIVPADAQYLSIYTKVFGPASLAACQDFLNRLQRPTASTFLSSMLNFQSQLAHSTSPDALLVPTQTGVLEYGNGEATLTLFPDSPLLAASVLQRCLNEPERRIYYESKLTPQILAGEYPTQGFGVVDSHNEGAQDAFEQSIRLALNETVSTLADLDLTAGKIKLFEHRFVPISTSVLPSRSYLVYQTAVAG